MRETYTPTPRELDLQKRFAFEKNIATWQPADQVAYLDFVNKKAGLPLGTIKPLSIKGVTIPYASAEVTIELANLHDIALSQVRETITERLAIYTYRATNLANNRYVDAVGACSLVDLFGEKLTNKIMHAETKAKRRATLQICGLALLDDSEVDSVEGAVRLEAPPKPQGAPGVAATTATTAGTVGTQSLTTQTTNQPVNTTPELPKQDSAPAVAASTATPAVPATGTIPVPMRFKSNPLFAPQPDTNLVGADKQFILFIVTQCTKGLGMPLASKDCKDPNEMDMTTWLIETYGLTNDNRATVLTFGMFKLISTAIDMGLTQRGL